MTSCASRRPGPVLCPLLDVTSCASRHPGSVLCPLLDLVLCPLLDVTLWAHCRRTLLSLLVWRCFAIVGKMNWCGILLAFPQSWISDCAFYTNQGLQPHLLGFEVRGSSIWVCLNKLSEFPFTTVWHLNFPSLRHCLSVTSLSSATSWSVRAFPSCNMATQVLIVLLQPVSNTATAVDPWNNKILINLCRYNFDLC